MHLLISHSKTIGWSCHVPASLILSAQTEQTMFPATQGQVLSQVQKKWKIFTCVILSVIPHERINRGMTE